MALDATPPHERGIRKPVASWLCSAQSSDTSWAVIVVRVFCSYHLMGSGKGDRASDVDIESSA